MRFDQLFLDDLRERVPISSVIGQRVAWDRKKTNASRGDYWGNCPFHGEKTPSFHCEDRKGRYHCFGCGVSGDHFRFLVELDGLSFPEAVERVADMAGVAMPAAGPRDEVREQRRAGLQDVLALSAQWFEEQLQSADGAKARSYLRDRGLSGRTQAEFRLGYAPESRSALKSFLAGKGMDRALIEGSGMVVSGEDIPVSYDRFRDRVMFPIEDSRGRIIAFGGRALAKDVPAKYLNSPETDVFSKGRTLYNFARARKAGQQAGTLIAVEGYMDVIALAQAGIANAVAPLGTALTEDQLDMLLRACDEPVLSFDGDAAGLRAAHRAIDLALPRLKPGKSVRFAILPSGQDPDDVVRQGGREAFDALLARSRPLSDMLWSRETQGGAFDTPEKRAELEANIRRLTALITDEGVRRHYAQDMRERMQQFFGAPRDGAGRRDQGNRSSINSGMGRGGAAAGRLAVSDSLTRSPLVAGAGQTGGATLREAAILVAAANHPALLLRDVEWFESLEFTPGLPQTIRNALLDIAATADAGDGEAVIEALGERGLTGPYDELETRVRNARLWTALPDAALEDAALFFEQATGLHRRISMLRHDLRLAEADLAESMTEEGFAALMALRDELNRLQQAEALVEGFGVLSGRAGGRG
ncbi:MAG: DNA primase [Rhizobiaceae bacterium]|nr:DNA primase [Rhizobiaceae bacterium]